MSSTNLDFPIKVGQTETVKKNLDPEWTKTNTFLTSMPENGTGCELMLEVWDWDMLGSNDFLGQVPLYSARYPFVWLACCGCYACNTCLYLLASPSISHVCWLVQVIVKGKSIVKNMDEEKAWPLKKKKDGTESHQKFVNKGATLSVQWEWKRLEGTMSNMPGSATAEMEQNRPTNQELILKGQSIKGAPTNVLLVQVVDAAGLVAADTMFEGGKSDPYCKLYWNNKPLKDCRCCVARETRRVCEHGKITKAKPKWRANRTKVIGKSLNPRWADEMFEIPLPKLVLQVWDHDTLGSDDFLGEASLEGVQLLRALGKTAQGADGDGPTTYDGPTTSGPVELTLPIGPRAYAGRAGKPAGIMKQVTQAHRCAFAQ
jgi:hypothetical protein